MARPLHDRLCTRELHVGAKTLCHGKVGAAYQHESQLGCTDFLVELCIATPRDVYVEAVRRLSEHLVVKCVSRREAVERRGHGLAEVVSCVSPPPLLAETFDTGPRVLFELSHALSPRPAPLAESSRAEPEPEPGS